jgi:putative hydrolase of the HAD superfamily
VLSNGRPDNQRGKLQVAGLLEFFETCRFSGETGLRKPDPAAFLDVLDVVRVSAGSSTWMLGDDPALDIDGAAAVGLSTLWVSHGRDWPTGLTEPTRSAVRPAEAFEALRTSR